MDTIKDNSVESVRLLGPEDVRRGDYVTVSTATYEVVPWPCCESWQTLKVHRVELLHPKAGRPLKVTRVCLPYVLVRSPDGGHDTLDLRRHRLVRLSDGFGRKAFQRLRPPARKRKK